MDTPKFDYFLHYLKNVRFAVNNSLKQESTTFTEESIITMFNEIHNNFEEVKVEDLNLKSNITIEFKEIYDASIEEKLDRLNKLRYYENYNADKINYWLNKFDITKDDFFTWQNDISEDNDLYVILDTHISWLDPYKEPDINSFPFLKHYDTYEVQAIQHLFQDFIKDYYVKKLTEFMKKRMFKGKDSEEDIYPFKDASKFNSFVDYKNEQIIEPYLDYSYLFQRLIHERFIDRISHLEFMSWLKEQKHITEKIHKEFLLKNQFSSFKKSSTDERENKFNLVFGI